MSTLRILDANRNRAAEAFRTAEEYARFVLGHGGRARALKEARHSLFSAFAAAGLGDVALLPARDVGGDVGREDTPASPRSGREVAIAALSRAAESLRVIEEYARSGRLESEEYARGESPALAVEAGRLRYACYEIQAFLGAARPPFRLYFVMSPDRLGGWPPLECALAAARGGADCVQLRDKSGNTRAALELARGLVEALAPLGVPLIVNDRSDLAVAAGAAGVHLGEEDLPLEAARRVVGAGRLAGATAHSVEEAVKRAAEGADYLGIGTIHVSAAKGNTEGRGLDLVRAAARSLDIPWVAIGGIDAKRAAEAVAAGAPGVAVGDAIGTSDDPEAAARRIRDAVDHALEFHDPRGGSRNSS